MRRKSTSKKKKEVTEELLAVGFYRSSTLLLYRQIADGEHTLFLVTSREGTKFSGRPQKIHLRLTNKTSENLAHSRDFRFFCDGDDIIMTYVRESGGEKTLHYAATNDRKTWVVAGVVKEVSTSGMLVPERSEGVGDTVYFGSDMLHTASSKDLKTWEIGTPPRVPQWHFFEGMPFEFIGAIPTSDGIAVFYGSEVVADMFTDVGLRDEKIGEERFIKIGAAFFSEENPTHLLWQAELPLVELTVSEGEKFSFLGVVPSKGDLSTLRIYTTGVSQGIGFFEFRAELLSDHKERSGATLNKFSGNPILTPSGHAWEADGTFNPTALKLGDKVHLLYRAVGSDGASYIGYAASKDGLTVDERFSKPVYTPRVPFESPNLKEPHPEVSEESPFHSGGSWGGCEDPKVVKIEDRIYMTYVAHAGYWPMRTALTSISESDFLKRRWRWRKPMLMSAPNVGSKSVVLLPEQINDEYVIFHRIWPNIAVDTVPELEFGERKRWLQSKHLIHPRRSFWDSQKLSLGGTPIKTKKGWLAIYNAVDRRDSSRYKIGAMLLHLKRPWEVLARSRKPILSPDEWYENDGKPGIAYPGGVVEINDTLHIYYGGADKVSCVATIPTEELLWHLLKDGDPRRSFTPALFS